jgi:NAD(P)-dependent dehydrogenase (short-subunit alcohol dehydrogenase family)
VTSDASSRSAGCERIAIVTGSDSGIGRACALALADAGFDIGVTWHTDEEGAHATAAYIERRNRRAVTGQLDLEDADHAAGVIEEIAEMLGGVDVLVNSAALNHRADLIDESLAAWRRVIDVDLTGPFACAKAAAQRMVAQARGGRIINITSIHEHAPLRRGGAYCAAKAGLGMLTKVMALELAPHGITVNSIAPGHVATPMNGYGDPDPAPVRRKGIPIGRIGLPAEIAAAVAYLVGDTGCYTTGASLIIDGGLLLMAVVPLQDAVEPELQGASR